MIGLRTTQSIIVWMNWLKYKKILAAKNMMFDELHFVNQHRARRMSHY